VNPKSAGSGRGEVKDYQQTWGERWVNHDHISAVGLGEVKMD